MIPLFNVNMAHGVGQAVSETLQSGQVAQGPKVDQFERLLKMWTGGDPVTVNSGTSALVLALKLAGVGPGDRVISTSMTCSATNLAILQAGARPVWADINATTGLIDPASVKELSSKFRPKAIMAVDWGGQPVDYQALAGVANGVPIISDSAHSLGATLRGKLISKYADYTCFSFQAIKHLTAGDGGALVCKDSKQTKRARDLRWFGIDRTTDVEFRGELDITEAGYKFHMNDVAATIGIANIYFLPHILDAHRGNAAILDRLLDMRFVRTKPSYSHEGSWWLYTILLASPEERDGFQVYAKEQGLQVSRVHWPSHNLSVFREDLQYLPNTERFASRMICIPVHRMADPYEVARIANGFFVRVDEGVFV